jgi:hypothetical protein
MSIAAGLILERIEYCEGLSVEADSEPCHSAGLGCHETLSAGQKLGDGFLFTWLGLQFYEQR